MKNGYRLSVSKYKNVKTAILPLNELLMTRAHSERKTSRLTGYEEDIYTYTYI